MNLKLISCCLPALYTQLDFQSNIRPWQRGNEYVSWPEASKGQKGTEGQYGQIRIALDFLSDFRKCLIALGMRYFGATRRFASFDQSNEKAFMPSVFRHKYLELKILDFRFLSEANLWIDIFDQSCFRILIKLRESRVPIAKVNSFRDFIRFLTKFSSNPKDF